MLQTQSSRDTNRIYFALFLILAAVVAFAFQGSRGLYESTEGRYAEVAREMLETGSYLEPTLGYQPHWTKPPLTYWAIVGGMKIFGVNEWGARFYLSVVFVLTTLVVSLIARTMWGAHAGVIAGLVYASSPYAIFACSAIATDALLTLFELTAILCYLRAVRPDARRALAWILLMWLAWALAFLTKGPPGLLPLIPLLIWHYWGRKKAPVLNPLGLALFVVVGFSWYVVECIRHPELPSYFLGREVVQRVLSEDDRNPQWYKPFEFYLPVLTVGAGVWFYWAAKLFAERRLFDPRRLWGEIQKKGFGSFLLLWLLIPLLIFSLAKSRLFLYVLPLYAPVALAAAGAIAFRGRNGSGLRKVALVATVSVLIFATAKGLAGYFPTDRDMRAVAALYRQEPIGNATHVLVNEARTYSIDFYVGQKVERVALRAKRGDPRPAIGSTLDEIKTGPKSDAYTFLVGHKKADSVAKGLDQAGLKYQKRENKDWTLYIVQARPLVAK